MNFVAKIKTMSNFFFSLKITFQKPLLADNSTTLPYKQNGCGTEFFWIFPLCPPPGLQEVVKIQNKYSTKSTSSSLNSGATFGKGVLEISSFLLVFVLFCFNCFRKNINH